MASFVALLRGINVGGHNKLPMKALRELLEGLGLEGVETYIQSGNVVFRAPKKGAKQLGAKISQAIEAAHGFAPDVMVLDAAAFEAAAKANPFPEADAAPKAVHLWFCRSEPKAPDLERLAALASANERYVLDGAVFYLLAPDGIGKSKLAEKVERALGVSATARNWSTVSKLVLMLSAS